MKTIILFFVRLYQKGISPFLPASCRYQPSCSEYMAQAVTKHGLRGFVMGVARILRCHPWTTGGADPVPDQFSLKRYRPPSDDLSKF